MSSSLKQQQDNLNQQPRLVLAPIRGVTDCHFRTIFHKHFPGFDSALAPFINPQRYSLFAQKQLRDMLPENNQLLPVVPQLLHTAPDDFIYLSHRLHDLGYEEANWNLGCPAPMVTSKKRGSGMLPFPEKIVRFLDEVMPKLPLKLSIKTRLGLEKKEELLHLLPLLDEYPLTEIIIHSRLGKQMYRGHADTEAFAQCFKESQHSIVYNGDIQTVQEFRTLQKQFPGVSKWMIGRGALADPFLAGNIKELYTNTHILQIEAFHQELFECYRELLSGQSHLLGHMKQLWMYLAVIFPAQQKGWKKIKKCRTESQYQAVVERLFECC